jgi:hypothetical protein
MRFHNFFQKKIDPTLDVFSEGAYDVFTGSNHAAGE